jgi:Domain of unknown function (DUF4267)
LDTLVHPVALVFGVVACAAIIVLGIRFLLQPRQATLDFGIAADSLRGLTEIKGARDITSGVVPLVVWASAGTTTLGWVLIAAAITPTADALIVLTNGGKLSKALGVHGLTAGLLVAAGLVLALG